METIRVLVVDDHPLLRQALRTMIGDEPGFEVVGEASNGEEAIFKARYLHPDLIIMDLYMPVKDGFASMAELTASDPEIRILALTSSTEENSALSAVEAGALGYVQKDSQPDEVLAALRQVAAGQEYWPEHIAMRLARGLRRRSVSSAVDLTEREREVLAYLGQGLSNKAIANKLCISEPTVRAHVYHILQKLGLENRTQAALYIQKQGHAK